LRPCRGAVDLRSRPRVAGDRRGTLFRHGIPDLAVLLENLDDLAVGVANGNLERHLTGE
jgi:hypothetical protein